MDDLHSSPSRAPSEPAPRVPESTEGTAAGPEAASTADRRTGIYDRPAGAATRRRFGTGWILAILVVIAVIITLFAF